MSVCRLLDNQAQQRLERLCIQIDRPTELWSAKRSKEKRAMRLPIDTSRLKFLVVAPAEPLRQFEEGKPRAAWAPRTDVNGEVLWRVQLVALGDGEAEIIRVAVPGDPNVAQGEMVG